MTRLHVIKNPIETEVILVTKNEIELLRSQYPSISMGSHDRDYLKDFDDNDIVGVLAGDINNIDDDNADLWFVNKDYFDKHYTIIKE